MTILDTTKDLSALFSAQVKRTPDAVALEDESTTWTYTQLSERVDRLALDLRRRGITRDKLVGVLLERSANYVIACLAALRAGGAFLVLELAYPPELLADVIEDAEPLVIVTHTAHVGRIKSGIPLIVLDAKTEEDVQAQEQGNDAELPPLPAEEDLEKLAFVSYTSGTTGAPKGIANPHRAAVYSYDLRFGVSDLCEGDRVACNVFFVWEILRPLLRGATVITIPDEISYDPVTLVELLASKNVTETLMTPTLLAAVIARHAKVGTKLPNLRTLWFNGEVVTTELARRAAHALPNVRLLNCYSISECHEVACGDIKEMMSSTDSSYCPVGPPIDPENMYILDGQGNKVKDGDSGELHVGGRLLAREYVNLPETTAKAFVPNTFDSTPGARMYKTGDLARKLPNGLMEITGRAGGMIKIRGYTVVPAKVETAIMEVLAVSYCAVVADGDGLGRQLVAYIVHDQNDEEARIKVKVDKAGYSPESRQALAGTLAQYMLPAIWVALDELPTHKVSGKVDIKALPTPASLKLGSSAVQTNGVTAGGSSTINEKAVAEVWALALNIPVSSVHVEHSFFDLGGHSLSLANLATRMKRTFGVPVPLPLLAGTPTLQGHVEIVKAARDGHIAAIQAELPAILRADATLAEDIKPASSTEYCRLSDANTVLLTGATGFLGAFLLAELLKTTTAHIICMVRYPEPTGNENIPSGMARLRKNLLDFGIWKDTDADRVEVLPGNLSRKRFGLSEEVFDELAERVQVIVHAGATVNLVYPYGALRDANIGGTREILRLAGLGGATVQHISTNGVLPANAEGWNEDDMIDVEEVPSRLADGYGQTKWVAEKLVLEAQKRGIPARIVRPGTISGHSVSGATNAWDLFSALIVESLQLGFAPDVKDWRAEMTPVDVVSRTILRIAEASNSESTKQTIYHIGDPHPPRTSSLFVSLNTLGFRTKPLNWSDWLKLWQEQRGETPGGEGAFTVDILRGSMPTIEFLTDVSVLKSERTAAVLDGDLQRPKVDGALIETYARHWYARGWLPRPPLRRHQLNPRQLASRKGPLAGKVAIVTGASSGIGEAVALALAREGCHVAIAARRVDALKALKEKISQLGVKALSHPTDVTKKDQVDSLVATTKRELGDVDILVACAGVMYFTMMANNYHEQWEQTVDVNCKGLLHCLSATVPHMLSRKTGHIVAISSDAGRKVFPGLGVYSASKMFVEGTLQALRVETAGTGLRVMSVQPGNVATGLLGMSTDKEALEKFGTPSGAKVLEAHEVADAIVYGLRQPEHVAMNEILIEPRDEPI